MPAVANQIDFRSVWYGAERWTVLEGRSPEMVFKIWGADIIYHCKLPRHSENYHFYFIRMAHDHKWRHAFSVERTVYCDERPENYIEAVTGKEARMKYLLRNCEHRIANLKKEIARYEAESQRIKTYHI